MSASLPATHASHCTEICGRCGGHGQIGSGARPLSPGREVEEVVGPKEGGIVGPGGEGYIRSSTLPLHRHTSLPSRSPPSLLIGSLAYHVTRQRF
ncbi:hypothetical protein FKM82_024263 [Ascaphus truei]